MANSQEDKQRQIRGTWQSILDYVNEDVPAGAFRDLVLQCLECSGITDPEQVVRSCKGLRSRDEIEVTAELFRDSLRRVLDWIIELSSPSNARGTIAGLVVLQRDAIKILEEHTRSVNVELIPPSIESPEGSPRRLMSRRVSKVSDAVFGICLFIRNQVNRHDLTGEPLTDVFPFGVCERSKCGRLFIIQRFGRARFCSLNCRSLTGKQRRKMGNWERTTTGEMIKRISSTTRIVKDDTEKTHE